jgi:hypothetical protein
MFLFLDQPDRFHLSQPGIFLPRVLRAYTKGFMITGHELALALRSAYLSMHRRADAVLARFGVTADQFVLMAAIAEGDGLTQQDLVRRLSSDASTVRAMLDTTTTAGRFFFHVMASLA